MTLLALICIGIILVVLITSVASTFILYRYMRPKTGPIKTVLKVQAGVVVLLLIGILVSALWPQGCSHPIPPALSGSPTCVSGTLRLGGSTAFQPLASKIAESYHNHCPGANFSFVPTKSETGLDSVEDGSIDIGDSDIYSTPEQTGLVDEQVAIVIFAVIINSDVGITNLTTSQIQGIYSGKYTNWKDLGGPDLAINALSRTTGSGTRFTFDKYILGSSERLSRPAQMKGTPEMIQNVQRIQGAIGYAALHDVQANQQSLITVNIDGEPPSPAAVTTDSYKFWTIEHMYTKQGGTSQLAAAFINYMGSSDAGQIIQNLSFANIDNTNASILSQRCPTN